MDGVTLQDRISRGMGVAARRIGSPYDVFRPQGLRAPLSRDNRRLRLHASFNAEDARFSKPASYGHALWWGVFDAAYTAPADYLVGAHGTFFIAAQQPLLPVLCVLTNRVISLRRPGGPTGGLGGYGGVQLAETAPLVLDWPASVLGVGSGRSGALPGDDGTGTVVVLLPPLPVRVRTGDLVLDDLERTLVVAAAEETALGFRLTARQAAS